MESARIADQLRRSVYGDAWHGPSVTEVLAGIDWQQAEAKPMDGAHSIWELALHITAWADAGSRRASGEAVTLTDAQDWPAVEDATEDSWRKTVEDLAETQSRFAEQISLLTDDQLDATVPGKEYNVYHLLHGVIQHNLYHAGQIALLKKL